jgi:hypothetical protein
VAGHRDTLFRGLGGIQQNDVILSQTTEGTFQYQVETTQIVTPDTVSVLRAGAYPQLTLVTCYPFHYIGPAPKRFIVKARLMSHDAEPPASPPAVAEVTPPREHKPKADGGRVAFQVDESHSRQLAPGISMGLSWVDTASQRVNGWVWFSTDHRTIWLRDQKTNQPVIFYGHDDGKRRELTITRVSAHSVSGYLVVPAGTRFN